MCVFLHVFKASRKWQFLFTKSFGPALDPPPPTPQNYHFFDVAPRRMNSPICFEFELFFLNLFFETDECKLVLRSVAPETSSAAITWSGDAMETLKYKIGLLRLVIKLDRIFFVLQKWGKSEQIERDICVFTLL